MNGPFQCLKCGNCCRPRGYVRLLEGEAELIAGFQGLDVMQFIKDCTRLTEDRKYLSLNEKRDGACIFLADDNKCVINDVKPQQCRDFPGIWTYIDAEEVCPAQAKTIQY